VAMAVIQGVLDKVLLKGFCQCNWRKLEKRLERCESR